ncbi:MAG: ComEC/Rec2 family competence protein [Clostridia bacterium]|nr:ComEC/Rec2 family competence protein [Clostridia bacterium]
MKRPLALCSFSVTCAAALAVYLGANAVLWLCTLFFVISVVFLCFKKLRAHTAIVCVLISSLVGFLLYSVFFSVKVAPIKQIKLDTDYEAKAVVTDVINYYSGDKGYMCNVSLADGDTAYDIKAEIPYSEIDANRGDTILCTMSFSELNDESRSYMYSQGVYLEADVSDYTEVIEVDGSKLNFVEVFLDFRDSVREKIYSAMPKQYASVLSAILTGNSKSLDKHLKTKFTNLSIYHLLVISGLHTTLLSLVVYSILMFITHKKKVASIGAIAFLFGFTIFAGASPSVVRSAIMTSMVLIGRISRNRIDSLTSIGLASFIITASNPFIAGNLGFLLTFSNVIGIVLLHPTLVGILSIKYTKKNLLINIANKIISSICVTISVAIVTLPYTILVFKVFSPYVVFTNLIMIPLVEIIIVLGFLACVISFIPYISTLSIPLFFITRHLIAASTKVIDLIDTLPASKIYLYADFYLLWLLVSSIIIAVGFWLFKSKSARVVLSLICCSILLIFVVIDNVVYKDMITLDFADCGNGVNAVLRKGEESVVISYGGNSYKSKNLEAIIHERSDDISMLLVTKSDDYIPKLMTDFYVDCAVVYDKEQTYFYKEAYKSRVDKFIYKDSDTRINLWQKANINFLKAKKSCFSYINLYGLRVLILPDNADCYDLPEKYRDVDIIAYSKEPKHIELLHYRYTVLCRDDNSSGNFNTFCTVDGKIHIDCREGKYYVKAK